MRKLENTTKTTAIYSDDNKHRYVLSKEWDNGGKMAMIIMLFPCALDITQQDLTTMICCNNLVKLDFSGIHILNLYSKINANVSNETTEINTSDNDDQILEYAKRNDVDVIILAYGKNATKKVSLRQKEVLKMLLPYQDKIMTLKDERGVEGLHPLAPSLRNRFEVVKFDIPDLKEEPKEAKGKKGKRGQKQAQNEAPQDSTEIETGQNPVTE